jgi:hypothetical protein
MNKHADADELKKERSVAASTTTPAAYLLHKTFQSEVRFCSQLRQLSVLLNVLS